MCQKFLLAEPILDVILLLILWELISVSYPIILG